MINKITGPRGSGKTTKLLKLAAENNGVVVTFNTAYARRLNLINHQAKVDVISYDSFIYGAYTERNYGRKFYIDELECFLHHLGVEGYTAREEEGANDEEIEYGAGSDRE